MLTNNGRTTQRMMTTNNDRTKQRTMTTTTTTAAAANDDRTQQRTNERRRRQRRRRRKNHNSQQPSHYVHTPVHPHRARLVYTRPTTTFDFGYNGLRAPIQHHVTPGRSFGLLGVRFPRKRGKWAMNGTSKRKAQLNQNQSMHAMLVALPRCTTCAGKQSHHLG